MGHRYYTKIDFPASAERIPEIGRMLAHLRRPDVTYSEPSLDDNDPNVFTIAKDEANYGHIDVTVPGTPGNEDDTFEVELDSLLKQHKVPFDWHHDESEGGNAGFYNLVRFEAGHLVEYERNDIDDGRIEVAAKVKDFLDEGDTAALETYLKGILEALPDYEDWFEWEPTEQQLQEQQQ